MTDRRRGSGIRGSGKIEGIEGIGVPIPWLRTRTLRCLMTSGRSRRDAVRSARPRTMPGRAAAPTSASRRRSKAPRHHYRIALHKPARAGGGASINRLRKNRPNGARPMRMAQHNQRDATPANRARERSSSSASRACKNRAETKPARGAYWLNSRRVTGEPAGIPASSSRAYSFISCCSIASSVDSGSGRRWSSTTRAPIRSESDFA